MPKVGEGAHEPDVSSPEILGSYCEKVAHSGQTEHGGWGWGATWEEITGQKGAWEVLGLLVDSEIYCWTLDSV